MKMEKRDAKPLREKVLEEEDILLKYDLAYLTRSIQKSQKELVKQNVKYAGNLIKRTFKQK